MGKRDIRSRETKKTKKDSKKLSPATIFQPPVTVEVVRKKRKEQIEDD